MIDPQGRVVMISGANRGIGLAIARNLYQAGFSLSLASRKISSLDGIVKDWSNKKILTSKFDAMDKLTHNAWVTKTLDKFGRID